MAKYLPDEVIEEARKFDKVVGATVAMLGMFGICSTPAIKQALVYHYIKENESDIDIIINRRKTVVMLTNLEESILTLLY